MWALTKVTVAAVVLGTCGWSGSSSSSWAAAADRTGEQIVKELDGVEVPRYDSSKKNDAAYVSQFRTKLQKTTEKRAALILELYKAAPEHGRIPVLMAERWSIRPFALANHMLLMEIDETLAHTQNPMLKIEGAYARTYARLYHNGAAGPVDLSGVDDYLKQAPKDPRGATLLSLAARRSRDEKIKTALEDRILSEFPETLDAQKIQGIRQKDNRIGKPFELEFKDAISGSTVSVKGLKGKVIVIDFWATWCGPCVAEMPRMKDLYAKFHDQGVEFIGISLDQPADQGGLDRLKKFVKEKEIGWPQYYQGSGWDSAFSGSCGIHEIPAVFVIDADGKLYSTDAGRKLDKLLPELIKKIKSDARSSGASVSGGE
jgi:thiol-disulfide isomerase/thioredoxin